LLSYPRKALDVYIELKQIKYLNGLFLTEEAFV